MRGVVRRGVLTSWRSLTMLRAYSSAPRLARASKLLLAAVVAAGCAHPSGSGGPAPACGFSADLKSASSHDLQACAKSVMGAADMRHGTGDEQRLAIVDPGGHLRYGPKASITPLRDFLGIADVTAVSDKVLANGVPMALIVSDSAYAKLGVQKGYNVLILSVPSGADSGMAAMIPVDGSTVTFLKVHVTSHKDAIDYPLATARWIWSDTDETIWVACGRRCCYVVPVAQ
jgi:hypothetical protein